MFGKSEADQVRSFIDGTKQLAAKTGSGSPKRVSTSLAYILERCAGFEGTTFDQLATHLTSKSASTAKKPTAPRKKAAPPISKSEIDGMVSYLEVAAVDPTRFKDVVDQYEKDCSAPVLKAVAAQFARSSKPKTKADAVRLLVAARNERDRAEKKAHEARKSTPW